jgi:hypothetical protein
MYQIWSGAEKRFVMRRTGQWEWGGCADAGQYEVLGAQVSGECKRGSSKTFDQVLVADMQSAFGETLAQGPGDPNCRQRYQFTNTDHSFFIDPKEHSPILTDRHKER